MLQTRVDSGLDGVIVADTVMSEVDGEEGRLIVRGHALKELIASRGFEGVAALLWDGYGEGGGDEAAVRDGLAAARVQAFAQVPKLLAATRRPQRRSKALRVGLGMLPDTETMPHHYPGLRRACRCSWRRCSMPRRACRRSRPIRTLTTAQDLLRMIRGQRAGEVFEKGARHLSGDRRRPRLQRLDLHRPGRGLDACRPDLVGAGRRSARSRGRCMAARRARCSTCWTRSARPRAPRPGSTMPSPRAPP